jgi:SAM-dependent methyltransferase
MFAGETSVNRKTHWEKIYANRKTDELGWYRTHLEQSLALIQATGAGREAQIIDVGGGASTLVDDLLAAGFRHLTILDISSAAIRDARARLGNRADEVTWREADITRVSLPRHHYDVWHDRAVFHFLIDAGDRQRYVETVNHAIKPGGHVIVATFGPHGPLQCSGLDIVRYTPEGLHREFGPDFQLVESITEDHVTPAGKHQEFIYCYCRKR